METRDILKSNFKYIEDTDLKKKKPYPKVFKGYREELIILPEVSEDIIKDDSIYNFIKNRKSIRIYSEDKVLSIKELSYLLWATQGVRKYVKNKAAFKNIPSAGSRHTFETYILVRNVESLKPGLYRYIALENSLIFEKDIENIEEKIIDISLGQEFLIKASCLFIWTTTPYRMEYKFTCATDKMILLDAGHLGQQMYLACESLGLGTCAIGAYDQEKLDELIGVDGQEELSLYLMPVGIKE